MSLSQIDIYNYCLLKATHPKHLSLKGLISVRQNSAFLLLIEDNTLFFFLSFINNTVFNSTISYHILPTSAYFLTPFDSLKSPDNRTILSSALFDKIALNSYQIWFFWYNLYH